MHSEHHLTTSQLHTTTPRKVKSMENITKSNPPEKKTLSHHFKEYSNNQAHSIAILQHRPLNHIHQEAVKEEPTQGMEVDEEDVAQDEEQIYSHATQLIKIKDQRAQQRWKPKKTPLSIPIQIYRKTGRIRCP